ncbi:P2Y purinoceptor 13 [Eublepharis macularius]|uniref:P2Y purinoceptor 13 n=1 Tax=Eublepharis macularius TaxID=481883 RepID=A0AA97JJ77_EUBMA|nr:P2Y purinoceptor 13 [Eublepharis macularius]XP_054839818.1 P2Y purinoceptor 13 [Eublepharis macularius]
MNESINISNETTSFSGQCHRDTTIAQVVFPILYSILFLAGFLLNSLAVLAFFQIPTTSSFIVYLQNILLSDFIMTLMLPLKILADSELGLWQLKAFVCRFSAVIFYNTMYISIVLLGLISLDRFLKIVRPFGKVWLRTVTSAKILSGFVWLFFFCLSLPNMVLSNRKATPLSVKKCASLKSHLGLKWHEAVNYICQVVFWTVLILILLFYVVIAKKIWRSYMKTQTAECKIKQRAKVKVFIIVAVFFICFAPFHFARVPYTLSQTGKTHDCSTQNQLFIAKEGTLWLAATNICMDPLIYILLCRQFVEKAFCIKMRKSRCKSQENTSIALDTGVST